MRNVRHPDRIDKNKLFFYCAPQPRLKEHVSTCVLIEVLSSQSSFVCKGSCFLYPVRYVRLCVDSSDIILQYRSGMRLHDQTKNLFKRMHTHEIVYCKLIPEYCRERWMHKQGRKIEGGADAMRRRHGGVTGDGAGVGKRCGAAVAQRPRSRLSGRPW